MSDRFTAAQGRKAISRASAEELGSVSRLVVDSKNRRIALVVIGKRRKARVVKWEDLSGFGADAVMVGQDEALHEPQDDREQAAAKGDLELLGRRVLNDLGNELGTINDIVFDPDSGALESLIIGDGEQPAGSLLGAGSYAVVLRADDAQPAAGQSQP
jgi:sporulation protein YlmC with PRC-barrel domain